MKISIKLFVLSMFAIVLTSCMEKGKLEVRNDVHNVRLENINWGDYSVYQNLLPGETSEVKEIRDYKNSWPKTAYLEFYMVADGKRVYLRTEEEFSLDYDNTLTIVISDSTEVINPLLD